MTVRRSIWIALIAAAIATAYNPPVDTAGPLTVRLQEPALGAYGSGGLADLARPGVTVTLPVSLQNSSARELRGNVRIGVIDRWTVDPAQPVPFTLGPHAHKVLEFKLTFGAGTHNSIYPIHAYAEFEDEGKRWSAHPILLLTPHQPDPPRARLELPSRPVRISNPATLNLARLPVRRASTRIDEETSMTPVRQAWDSLPAVQFSDAVEMSLGPRPPASRERVAAAQVEYPLEVPAKVPITLRFSTKTSGPEAIFRVRVRRGDSSTNLAEFRHHGTEAKRGEVALTAFGGETLNITLEAEAVDASKPFTASFVEPTISAGEVTSLAATKAVSLGTVRGHEISIIEGRRGLLDTKISIRRGAQQLTIDGFRVRVLNTNLEDPRCPFPLKVTHDSEPGRVRHHFETWAGPFDLVTEMRTEGPALRIAFRLEKFPGARPWLDLHIESVAAGAWSAPVHRIYAGTGNVLVDPQAFQLSYDGHRLATSYVGFEFPNGMSMLQATDAVPDRLAGDPAKRLYSLETPHEQTMTLIPDTSVWTAVQAWRELTKPTAAKAVQKLAGRFVFDLWSGHYAASATALEKAFEYGLTDSAVVWHNWQRWGYDYRLPDIYPPNPEYGTLEEYQRLVKTCKDAGVLFAPHDNYIDFYPDAAGFSYGRIAFEPDGRPRKAWFHYDRLAQSYRARPDQLRKIVERNLTLIRNGFAPNAYFIDVWSSMAPYDFWTEDGLFIDRSVTRSNWAETFVWIRDFLGNAPQISEAGHDALIGSLDGSQAQMLRVDPTPGRDFVWNIKAADAERIPWSDFAYHDLFVQHGAGYPGRYEGGLDPKGHGIYSDDYISVEVMTGHPGMVDAPFSRDVVRKYWLLHDLMRALAGARIEAVEFDQNNIHRQTIRWSNGAIVHVNRSDQPWTVEGHTLPLYGWHARFKDGEAAVELRNGARVEWSHAQSVYENGERRDAQGKVLRLP